MSTTTKAFENKGVYHSALVKATLGGPIALMFTGKPRESTYPNKPPFVGFKAQGDETAYTLNIENDAVRHTLNDAPLNVWLMVRASGTRDDAYLTVEDANGNPVLHGTPEREIAQPQNGPPPNWPEEPKRVTTAPQHPVSTNTEPTVQRAVAMTVAAVQGLEKSGIRVDSDAAARIYSTHFIQATR